jgi:hypothetical protein
MPVPIGGVTLTGNTFFQDGCVALFQKIVQGRLKSEFCVTNSIHFPAPPTISPTNLDQCRRPTVPMLQFGENRSHFPNE